MGMNAADETQLTSLAAPAYHDNGFGLGAQKRAFGRRSRFARR